jgi:hypothetical protein
MCLDRAWDVITEATTRGKFSNLLHRLTSLVVA